MKQPRPNPQTPRILFFTSVFGRSTVGGTTFVSYLLGASRRGDANIRFASADIQGTDDPLLLPVRTPALLNALPLPWLSQSVLFRRLAARPDVGVSTDLIWHNNLITAAAFALFPVRVPVVGMINDYSNLQTSSPLASRREFGAYRSAVRWFWRGIERFVARRVDTVVVNSEYLKRRVIEEYGVPPERVELLYKGVDLDRFSPDSTRTLAESPSPPTRILFLKSDFVRGGLWDLFEALQGLPEEVTLTVAGPAESFHSRIMTRARDAGLADRVFWRGNTPHREVDRLLGEHDMLCVPSRSEALGVVFLEALAAGIPAVGTSAGGISEVLDGGRAGWLAPPQDPAGLLETLKEATTNHQERASRVSHGLGHVRRFSTVVMIDRLLALAGKTMRPIK